MLVILVSMEFPRRMIKVILFFLEAVIKTIYVNLRLNNGGLGLDLIPVYSSACINPILLRQAHFIFVQDKKIKKKLHTFIT
jgi:hypothetical protein